MNPRSLLDNDLYQLTMSELAWLFHRERVVRYRFRNRTFSVPLAESLDVDGLGRELDAVAATTFTADDVARLRGLALFRDDWLDALSDVRLPQIDLEVVDGHLELTYEGAWWQAIFLETPVLATVTGAYQRRRGASPAEGERRLDAKVAHLAANPGLRVMEFGSRRRHSADWQRYVLQRLLHDVPENVLGTSNVLLATDLGIPALGTIAHQVFMVRAALDLEVGVTPGDSAAAILAVWEEVHPTLLTLLPDTYTTPYLLPRVPACASWPTVRIDSGDPHAMGRLVVEWWRSHGEDPREHTLLFSDALDVRRMHLLHDAFAAETGVAFGWGTDLTNDVGLRPLSLVIKPDAVDGLPCVKLSDDVEKATGDRGAVERYLSLVRASC